MSGVQDENLLQVRLNRAAIQADALASPERAEAILHDPPMLKGALKAPFCYA